MNSRPGDVFHPDFQQGRPAYFDIMIRNSLQSSYISMSAREAGAAAWRENLRRTIDIGKQWREQVACSFH